MTSTRSGFRWSAVTAAVLLLLTVTGCATPGGTGAGAASGAVLNPDIRAALASPAAEGAPMAGSPRVSGAASNSHARRSDGVPALPVDPVRAARRISVNLNNATPEVVFMALLHDTPLSVAVDPALKGTISISLKDVTTREALELLRELHGLEYTVIGRHILVSPSKLQTRVFTVNYPVLQRVGRSEVRVSSGSITQSGGSGGGSGPGGSSGSSSSGSAGGSSAESSRVTTSQKSDLWGELEGSVKLLIGDKEGRSVIVSPQTGTIIVRALPSELRGLENYLDAARVSVERQVMLEAKVVEVQLRDSMRSGINWAAFRNGNNSNASAGVLNPGTSLSTKGNLVSGNVSSVVGSTLQSLSEAAGGLLGLAFQTSNFAAVLEFLGTQGDTQVLSSPRIATMNNQKAVLKVGTDDFFVTNISTVTNSVGNSTSTSPNISVQPFFSGIALDVTPNIDADGYITLHVHPAVSSVRERNKVLNLGSLGSFSLPLASADINESDAVVRARDGHIIAIGGLMRQTSSNSDSGLPGAEGSIFRKLLGGQTDRMTEKRELVILLKPTLIDPNGGEGDGRRDALSRLMDWMEQQPSTKAVVEPAAPATVQAPRAQAAALPAAAAEPVQAIAERRDTIGMQPAPTAAALAAPARAVSPAPAPATATATATANTASLMARASTSQPLAAALEGMALRRQEQRRKALAAELGTDPQ